MKNPNCLCFKKKVLNDLGTSLECERVKVMWHQIVQVCKNSVNQSACNASGMSVQKTWRKQQRSATRFKKAWRKWRTNWQRSQRPRRSKGRSIRKHTSESYVWLHIYGLVLDCGNSLSSGRLQKFYCRKTSNISCTVVGNKTVDHSDVVGASPVGAAPTISSFST